MPNITFDGQHSTTSFGTGGSNSGSVNRKLGIAMVNNWLWTKGRNTFNIGWEIRRSYQDDNEEQTEGGQFNFSQKQTRSTIRTTPTSRTTAARLPASCWDFRTTRTGPTPRRKNCATGISLRISRTTSS